MNMLPTIKSYGQYNGNNYGVHTLKVDLGAFELFYSYETIVAFCSGKTGLVCSENNWGVTTGKHLNWIVPNKKERIPYSQFKVELEEMLSIYIKEN